MTPAAVRTVDEGGRRAGGPMPRPERLRLRRERRRVVGFGLALLCALLCVVVLVLDHLHHGRAAPLGAAVPGWPMEVHVTDMAA